MNKMRLAVFNTQPPLYFGGVERRILETAKRLSSQLDITVYSGTKAGLREPRKINGINLVPCFSTDVLFPLDNWTFNRSLARNADLIKADVYESHTASGYGLFEALRKKRAKTPFIQTIHGVLADEYAQSALRGGMSVRSKLANLLMWKLAQHEEESAKQATLIVTISKYSKRKILEYYNTDSSKIRIVPNGVDTKRFKPGSADESFKRQFGFDNRPSVLFVGRLIPRKGLKFLIEAAKIVVSEIRNAVFILIGSGPLGPSLKAEIEEAGISGNFRFLGDVSEKDLTEAYRYCDVFVLPSIQEGQGIVLLEAQASAKPVVAFNVSGVAEAVCDKKTGFLVRAADSKGLAEAVLKLLSDSSLRLRMGAYGREFVKNQLSWDVCAKKMFAVYCEVKELA